ncbi:ATP-binding protein [Pareuzebyella sediminis]|uniref:ATP-binding protein n=1 Tax=Pareuzebyella sediminis TaxID=2607998 RepID=UPI0011F04C5D|nr:ATP-binding protein [Pareuzebyella sediminis]
MDFKRVSTSTKTYIISLVLAIAVLLFSVSMTYRQIKRSQESSELIAYTLKVYNTLSELSAYCIKAESEEFKRSLMNSKISTGVLEDYRSQGRAILDRLRILVDHIHSQKQQIPALEKFMETLHGQMEALIPLSSMGDEHNKSLQLVESNIGTTLYRIRSLKNEMLSEEKQLMLQREADYASTKFLAPATSLLLGFFALLVFVLAFYRIYHNKLKLRESENFLKNVLSTTDNIVNYYEPIFGDNKGIVDFKIAFANSCNYDYFNRQPKDIVGKKVSEVFPFLLLNGELEKMIKCYQDQKKADFKRQVAFNGEKMWLHSVITPMEKGILVTVYNTTAEESAKEAQLELNERLEEQNKELLDNRAFLNNIFKSISHVVMHLACMRDDQGRIFDFRVLFVNERLNNITGHLTAEILNKKASEVFPNIFESGVFEHLVESIETDNPINYETSYTNKGETKWFRATAIKLNDGVTITTQEITEEKAKASQLQELNEQLSVQNSIFKESERVAKTGSFIWYLDTGDAVISENFYRILGHEPDSFPVTYESYRDFVHPKDRAEYDRVGIETQERGKTDVEGYRIITAQGNVKYLSVNNLYIEKDGRPTSLGVVQDITDRIRKDEDLRVRNIQLRKSNAELESFNRVASHDLQEPLRKIQMFISRIEATEMDKISEKGRDYFNKVDNAAARMQSLIVNLLTYSRIEGRHENFEEVDLNDILHKALDNLSTIIENSNTKVKGTALPEVKGVAYQLEQLFSNLISNAIKYKKENQAPQITINSERINQKDIPENFFKKSDYFHKITIEDNGIGFGSEHSEKIFEVFQRLHQKSQYSGTGIGLAICKKIIENHHGYIYATSSPGEGSTFIFYLPG